MDVNGIFKELAEYNRIAEETAAVIEGLKDQLKEYMTAEKIDTLTGSEHKATYKPVISNRIDTKALKSDLPDVAKKYTVSSSSMRFVFA